MSGQVLAEKGTTKQGSDWLHTHTANYYSAAGTGGAPAAISSSSTAGTSTGSLLYFSETKNWKNGGTPPVYLSTADYDYEDSYQRQYYDWRDTAVQTSVTLVNRNGTSNSFYDYDDDGALAGVTINGGTRPRRISYATNLTGQVLTRYEYDDVAGQNDPWQRSYYFGGQQMVGRGKMSVAEAQAVVPRRMGGIPSPFGPKWMWF